LFSVRLRNLVRDAISKSTDALRGHIGAALSLLPAAESSMQDIAQDLHRLQPLALRVSVRSERDRQPRTTGIAGLQWRLPRYRDERERKIQGFSCCRADRCRRHRRIPAPRRRKRRSGMVSIEQEGRDHADGLAPDAQSDVQRIVHPDAAQPTPGAGRNAVRQQALRLSR
jgi:hypothetical protein